MISSFATYIANRRCGRNTITVQKYYFTKIQFTLEKRLSLYKKVLSKLNAGLDLMTSLNEIYQVYAISKPDHHLVTIIGDMIVHLEEGQKFHAALHRWGPPGEAMLVQAGELSSKSDSLKTGLKNLVQTTESILVIKKSVISTLSYPAVLLVALIGIIIYFSTSIIPELSEFSRPEQWTFTTQAYHSVVTLIGAHYIVLLAIVTAVVILISYSMGRFTHPNRQFFDYIPPWSLYRQIQGAILLNAISGMMSSGVDMMSSLKELTSQASPYLKMHIKRMLLAISSGDSLGESLNTGLFGFDTSMDLIIYGRTKDFLTAMQEISSNTIEHVIGYTKQIGSTLSLIVVLLLASFIVLSLSSMWEMVDSSGTLLQ